MKSAVICLAALLAVAFAFPQPEEGSKYTDKYDNIDVKRILSNDRLLNSYFKCLMDKGNCTPEGTELKKVLPDALTTGCEKCTETQKSRSREVISFLAKNKSEMWEELKKKYDPEGVYEKKFEAEAKELGIIS